MARNCSSKDEPIVMTRLKIKLIWFCLRSSLRLLIRWTELSEICRPDRGGWLIKARLVNAVIWCLSTGDDLACRLQSRAMGNLLGERKIPYLHYLHLVQAYCKYFFIHHHHAPVRIGKTFWRASLGGCEMCIYQEYHECTVYLSRVFCLKCIYTSF